jgi:hypothetical protein
MKRKNQRVRDRNILEIVGDLLLSEVAFQEIFKKYKENSLRFSDIGNWVDDKGQSLLYTLKERSHFLFRDMEQDPVHKNEWLLDLAIGSIFHEAMKLRESLYQIGAYRPKYLQYISSQSVDDHGFLEQFERIFSKAQMDLAEGMEETRSLFRDTMSQLVDFLKRTSRNPLLVRFLLEHRPLLRRVYGAKGLREIFNLMFEKGLLDAYVLAGRSYLESGHYDLSSLYFSKALKLDIHHSDLRFLLNFSLGMKAYYSSLYSRTLSHFTELIRHKSDLKREKEYLRKAEEVCWKIASELEEGEKLKRARRASHLANRIKERL